MPYLYCNLNGSGGRKGPRSCRSRRANWTSSSSEPEGQRLPRTAILGHTDDDAEDTDNRRLDWLRRSSMAARPRTSRLALRSCGRLSPRAWLPAARHRGQAGIPRRPSPSASTRGLTARLVQCPTTPNLRRALELPASSGLSATSGHGPSPPPGVPIADVAARHLSIRPSPPLSGQRPRGRNGHAFLRSRGLAEPRGRRGCRGPRG